MRFHNYLEQAVGNKLTIKLLRTMVNYRGKIFTVRSLAKTARVSLNETALTIHELEKLGIIKIQPIGKAYHLYLNEKNYILNKIINPMFNVEKNTLDKLLQILKKHFATKKITSVALFGSVSKGEENDDSDIDLIVISDDFNNANLVISTAADKVLEIFHSKISSIIFTKKEFASKKDGKLVQSIIANYTMVYGKNLAGIIK